MSTSLKCAFMGWSVRRSHDRVGKARENKVLYAHRLSGLREEVTRSHTGSQEKHRALVRWQETVIRKELLLWPSWVWDYKAGRGSRFSTDR